MIKCGGCGSSKPEDEFYWKNKEHTKRQEFCKTCKSRYNKTWYAKNKESHKANVRKNSSKYIASFYDLVNTIKSETPCKDCKQYFPAICMDFDHLPEFMKSNNVSAMTGYNIEKIKAEIDKCEIVCSNCHRIRTAQRRLLPKDGRRDS